MNHLNINQILAYVHGLLNEADILEIDGHLSKCDHCAKRIKSHYMLKDHFEEIWSYCVDEEYEKETIKESILGMISVMRTLSKNPLFKGKCDDVIRSINQFFSSPVLSLSPTFGGIEASDIIMLSPFGKVRFPIVFEWEKIRLSGQQSLKSKKEFRTESTRIELDLNILPFELDKEYEWEILIIDHEENQIEGPIGYFYTCTNEEIDLFREFDNAIMNLDTSDEMRHVLNGVMHETNEFYIDAITKYKKALTIKRKPELILRIAKCYENLGLTDLREEWRCRLEEEIR